jgi:hypothetical protein
MHPDLFTAVRAAIASAYGPDEHAALVVVHTREGHVLTLTVPPASAGVPQERPEPAPDPDVGHSPDFRSVRWHGRQFAFTRAQAAAVSLLWDAWRAGAPDVGDELLRRATDTASINLRDSFRGSDAWGVLIVPGGTRGTHRLAEPPARPRLAAEG